MTKIDSESNSAIGSLIDCTMQPIDWTDFQTLRTDSPSDYRKTIATLGKLLAKRVTIRLDQHLTSEVDHADF